MTEPQTQSGEEALWQAFLYVQGDMSVKDTESFEQQMLDDADLCEKVAEASLLSSAMLECRNNKAVIHNRSAVRSPGLRRLAVIVAGCCCPALMMSIADRSEKSPTMNADTTDGTEASVLLAAWIDNADSGDGEVEEDEQTADSTIDSELTVPDWMLAGISDIGTSRTTDSTTPQPNSDDPELL